MGTFLVHRLINEQNKKAVESAASAAAEWNILFFLPIYAEGDALIVGALIFTIRGIGKSTPTIKAFPFLNIVKIVALLNIDNSISFRDEGSETYKQYCFTLILYKY